MIIDDFDIVSVANPPYETDSPLIVDSNAVLAFPVTAKFLEAVTRRHAQILQRLRIVQHRELTSGGVLNALKTCAALAIKERFRVFASERSYHRPMLLRIT
jgi:hypothetical protein